MSAATIQLQKRFTRAFPASSVRARLASGTLWSLLQAVGTYGLTAVATITAARLLGKTGFGELAAVEASIGMFGVFAGLGLGMTANKHIAEFRVSDPQRAGRILGLAFAVAAISGTVIMLLVALGADWIAARTLAAPQLGSAIRFGSPLLLLSTLSSLQGEAMCGLEAFRRLAICRFSVAVILATATVIGVVAGGVGGAVAGIVVAGVAGVLIFHRALSLECRRAGVAVQLRGAWAERGVLWSFSLPNVLAGAVIVPATWAASAILVHTAGGYGQLALYNASNHWQLVLRFLPAQLLVAAMPIMASTRKSDGDAFARTIDVSHSIIAVAIVPMAVLLIAFARPVMGLYGSSFSDGGGVLALMLAGTAISCIGSPAGTALNAGGKAWLSFAMSLGWGVSFIIVAGLTVHRLGATGVALAFCTAHALQTTWAYLYLRTTLPAGMFVRTAGSIATVLLAAAVLATTPPDMRIVLGVPLAIAVSGVVLLGLISPAVRRAVCDAIGGRAHV